MGSRVAGGRYGSPQHASGRLYKFLYNVYIAAMDLVNNHKLVFVTSVCMNDNERFCSLLPTSLLRLNGVYEQYFKEYE